MKTLIIKIVLALSLITFWNLNFISNVYADTFKVIVTEKVPWVNCRLANWWLPWKWPYECDVEKWFWSLVGMMWEIIKYFTFLTWLWWVLYLVINWIMYSMWWMDPWMKDESKKRIIQTLVWLILLLLSWVILNLIAPWIYKW